LTAPPSRAWALVAVACYAIHAGHHVARGHAEDALWACHVGTLLVAAGFCFRSPLANAIGFLWLVVGNVCWIGDLASGDTFFATSTLTHVGGLALAIFGVRRFGLPAGAWWRAMAAFVALQLLTRWTTPADANVNVAFRVWSGWEDRFPSYPRYMAMLWATGLIAFAAIVAATRRLLPPAGRPALRDARG
jgi:hypothetical protein